MAGPLKNIALLGATGSIGGSTLDVVARHPERFRIGALSAHTKVDELVALCERFRPDVAVIADAAKLDALAAGLRARGLATRPLAGADALDAVAAAPEFDVVVAALVGAAGVSSTLAEVRPGRVGPAQPHPEKLEPAPPQGDVGQHL